MINFIVECPTMCHADQRAVTGSGKNDWLHKYTTLIYLETPDKAYHLQLAVVERCVTCSLKLKLMSVVIPKETST